jgi:hypothetical protein
MKPLREENSGFAIPSTALVAQFSITFAIAWSIVGSYVVFPETTTAIFGEISGVHPLYFLVTWAPAIAGFAVVLFYTGTAGLRAFLGRLLLWRCAPIWWFFIIVGLPLVYMIGSLLKGGPLLAPLPPEGLGPALALLAMMLFLGPIEEFGWPDRRRLGRLAPSGVLPCQYGLCQLELPALLHRKRNPCNSGHPDFQ